MLIGNNKFTDRSSCNPFGIIDIRTFFISCKFTLCLFSVAIYLPTTANDHSGGDHLKYRELGTSGGFSFVQIGQILLRPLPVGLIPLLSEFCVQVLHGVAGRSQDLVHSLQPF